MVVTIGVEHCILLHAIISERRNRVVDRRARATSNWTIAVVVKIPHQTHLGALALSPSVQQGIILRVRGVGIRVSTPRKTEPDKEPQENASTSK